MSRLFPGFRERQRRGYMAYKVTTALWSIVAILVIVAGVQGSDTALLLLGVGNLAFVFAWGWLGRKRPRLGMLLAGGIFALDALIVFFLFGPDSLVWAVPAFMGVNSLMALVVYRDEFEPEAIP